MHTRASKPPQPAFTRAERPAGSGRKRSAFTLVELLVVIALILMLASLLLPALNRAMDSARMTICINNLHQIATATFTFASDHDGLLPYGVQNESWGWVWETCLIPYLGLGTFSNGLDTVWREASRMIIGYTWMQPPRTIVKPGPLACPQDNPYRNWAPDYFLLKSYSGNSGFCYDGAIAYGGQNALSSVPQPNHTLMYAENYSGFCGMNWGRFQVFWPGAFDISSADVRAQLFRDYGLIIPVDFANYIATTWLKSKAPEYYGFCVPAGFPFHRGGMNVAICDGSVRNMRYEDTFYPTNYWSWHPWWKKTSLD